MHIDPTRLFRTDKPRSIVVLDAEVQYDYGVHRRYQASERWLPDDAMTLSRRQARADPRVTPRWPCQRIVALSYLVMSDGGDGLRPVRMTTCGAPEQNEVEIVRTFFDDMERLGAVQLVTWNGFGSDLPHLLLAAAAAGLRLPTCLAKLHAPWQRDNRVHLDLMSEMCGGANRVHLAEIAAKLDIPVKLTCRPDLVSRLMEQGKWSSVKAVVEGDVLSTALVLMRWQHLLGGSVSILEIAQRLTSFVNEHCGHRAYAPDWTRYRDRVLHDVVNSETAKRDALAM